MRKLEKELILLAVKILYVQWMNVFTASSVQVV